MKQRYLILAGLTGVWLAAALFVSRHYLIDDALIHLRYAALLRRTGFFTYDGKLPSFGTSSLLWVGLLALLRGVTESPLLGKWLSVVFYLGLLGVLAAMAWRVKKEKWIVLCLLATALMPMGVRWLTDGMETSLSVLFAALLAAMLQRRRPETAMRAGLYALFSAAIVLLRIEMLSLVGIAGLLLWLRENDVAERSGIFVAGVRQAMPLWFGGCLAILWIRWRFGYFLPDTALAKTSQSGLAPLGGIALALASSFGLGLGFMVLWLASLALVLRAVGRRESLRGGLAVWVANLPFPLVVALSCARGQAIQGVRYVLWPLIFSTVWNAMEINRRECRAPRWSRALAVCIFGILVILLPLDAHYAFKSMLGRSRTFMEMRDGGLERFAGKTIVAGDVGFIGYFGHADICDMDGLVNGRGAAAMTVDARLAACARQGIDAAFVTLDQMRAVETVEDIRSWTVCRKYDFQNVRQPDRHYLLVPEAAECGADVHPLGTASSLMSR